MKKTSISTIYHNLWAPTAGLLQDLTVMQQCVYHIKFRNVCEVKKRLVQPELVWSRTLQTILLQAVKNRRLDEISAKVSEMLTKCVLRVMLIKQSYHIG